jgi:RsiW-degrading membrane proteinase PrsW (M82 family)
MTQLEPVQLPPEPQRTHSAWWKTIMIGALLYVIALGTLFVTNNPNLFPTVVMVGSFLVPFSYVAFFYERRHLSKLTMPTTAMSMVYGGLLGVIAASILEPIFIQQLNAVTAFGIGFIEEFVKILGVLVVARHWRHDSELDGLILGAAAGMGFAALESSGYAFSAFLQSNGSLSATVGVTLLRGLFSPLGHGTWTAILAAVLFRESKAGHFRINLQVIGAYLTVVILHGLWDAVPAALSNVTVPGVDVFLGQVAVGAPGLLILWRRWKEGVRLQREAAAAAVVELAEAEMAGVEIKPTDLPYDGDWIRAAENSLLLREPQELQPEPLDGEEFGPPL